MTASAPCVVPTPLGLVVTTRSRFIGAVRSTLTFWHTLVGLGQTVTVPPMVSESTAVASLWLEEELAVSVLISATSSVVEVGSTLGRLC